jgi:hypothetical protein
LKWSAFGVQIFLARLQKIFKFFSLGICRFPELGARVAKKGGMPVDQWHGRNENAFVILLSFCFSVLGGNELLLSSYCSKVFGAATMLRMPLGRMTVVLH